MPELPEVETTKTSLAVLLNQQVASVAISQPKLRYAIPSDLSTLVGFRLTDVSRRAKYLLLTFFNAQDNRKKVLLIHLGMSGSLQNRPAKDGAPMPIKHDHVVITFADDDGNITPLHYHDPRRFGMILWAFNDDFIDNTDLAYDRFLAHLGPEPLSCNFNADYLYQYITHSRQRPIAKPIKAVIMDQSCVVGVGNIYATESLFLSRIHPQTPAHLLSFDEIATLVEHIKAILQKAIIQGGTTLKDFSTGNGKTGYFQQVLLAYGRQNLPCTVCGTPLESVKITGRASVYCPHCQKKPSN
ncbi:bifunctional DNA-formamidopyrimidine glycosylase/DNA-(apurinic or apyrimidinic site) lyase [Moraxella nasovis]|uniref:bifunctional DNA-formamidopyrimidine glycosylase/DNA-(apurinic or apyrimidinic site) lyase n=1 Tax=Moraxella nasovis TaxID=2904121 RepID=UPI001F61BB5B|nr:bifunctional DNA-formamidopyrimidine glycosylase/DNA-(apurinic or apyrimidinic site) lyase [Moraxella nasovis]UNU74081.1 bifunctional DNA-formamidopyrimidine glycosylase/DNA-(apurinic or apyrimidinic site) lyase [Moraxella nasovis]